MVHKFKETEMIYVRSMGKALKVLAIVTSVEEANAYSRTHDNAAVVAEFGPFVFMADRYDPGTPIPRS